MGVPVLAIASLAMTAVGSGISAIGAYQQEKAQANAASYNAQVARNAAIFAQQQGTVEAEAQQRKTAGLIGRERAAAGASNVDVNTGSPLDIQADTAAFGQENVGTVLSNAQRQAWGYSTQAGLDEYEAANYRAAAPWAAAGSLIGGAGRFAGQFSQMQQSGVFNSDPFNPGAGSSYASDFGYGSTPYGLY